MHACIRAARSLHASLPSYVQGAKRASGQDRRRCACAACACWLTTLHAGSQKTRKPLRHQCGSRQAVHSPAQLCLAQQQMGLEKGANASLFAAGVLGILYAPPLRLCCCVRGVSWQAAATAAAAAAGEGTDCRLCARLLLLLPGRKLRLLVVACSPGRGWEMGGGQVSTRSAEVPERQQMQRHGSAGCRVGAAGAV